MSDVSKPTTRRTKAEIERYRMEYARIFGRIKPKIREDEDGGRGQHRGRKKVGTETRA